MFLLSAAVVPCSALLQCFNQLVRQLANHHLCHRSTPKSTVDSDDSVPKNVYMSAQWTKRVLLVHQAWNDNNAQGNHAQPDIGKYLRSHLDPLLQYDPNDNISF